MIKYPDLKSVKLASIDIETFDPNLLSGGTGVYRDDGYILGVSVRLDNGFSEYYNLGHYKDEQLNKSELHMVSEYKGKPKNHRHSHYDIDHVERRKNIQYIKEILRSDISILGANIKYDLDWLCNWLGLKCNGELLDIQIAEPLINENQHKYSLDFLGNKYLDRGKLKNDIEDFTKRNGLRGDPRQWLYLMPYELVRGYALEDVNVPFEVFEQQKKILEEQELTDLFKTEMKLYPFLLHMRKIGVRIDEKSLSSVKSKTLKILDKCKYELNRVTGKEIRVNHNSSDELAFILDKLDIDYPLTEKTKKPSITKPWLMNNIQRHPVFELINNCRKFDKLNSTFLESQIGGMVVNGRIHSSFNQLKSDDYGTVSGRFSSSNPNLQFIPANDPDIGKTIRSLFLPEEDQDWIKADYSQIEVRIISHYAMGPGSEEIRKAFIDDSSTDFHQWCSDVSGLTKRMGKGGRKYAKRINFGIFYGMGIKLLMKQLGMDEGEAKAFMSMYFNKLPFIKTSIKKVSNKALTRGYVKTILGRRRRFPDGEKTYKAFNSIVQGSAADLLKVAMVESWEKGIYNVLTPHITVHDELDQSMPRTPEGIEAVKEMKNIMENCVKIRVPIVADFEIGPNWGQLNNFEGEYHER